MRKSRLLLLLQTAVLVTTIANVAFADPNAGPTAQALLQKIESASGAAQTMTADLTKIDQDGTSVEATLRLMKPNYACIVSRNARPDAVHTIVASDGKSLWRYPDQGKNEYTLGPADPAGAGTVAWLGGVPIEAFFGLENALKNGGINASDLKYDGRRAWNGQSFQILRHEFEEDGKRYTAWLYVGQDNLIHRLVGTYYIPKPDGTPRMFEVALTNIKIGMPMRAAQFTHSPPPGAQRIIPKPLLTAGTVAPDFGVSGRDGSPLRLSDFRGRVVVLDFWATWCLPCVRGMAHTNSVAAQFKDKNVAVLAVNVWDGKEPFQTWLPIHPEYGALVFAIDTTLQGKDVATTLYQVSGIPTQYVIDRNGKVVASFVGYTGPTPELENAVRAAISMP